MSTYFTALDTDEGLVHIITKTRWLGLIPMPHTSVMSHGASDLKDLGTFIKWSTTDADRLAILHDSIVHFVQQNGISSLAEIGRSVKMTEQVANVIGADWHDIIKEAAREGVSFPFTDDVLKDVRTFV